MNCGGVLLLLKLDLVIQNGVIFSKVFQTSTLTCNFTRINIPPEVVFKFCNDANSPTFPLLESWAWPENVIVMEILLSFDIFCNCLSVFCFWVKNQPRTLRDKMFSKCWSMFVPLLHYSTIEVATK